MFENFDHHNLSRIRITEMLLRNQKIMCQVLIIGHNIVDTLILIEPTHDPPRLSLQHLKDTAFTPSPAIDAADTNQRAVIVHERTHLARGKIKIFTPIIRTEKAESIGVRNDAASDQICLIDNTVAVFAVTE